MEIKSMEIKLKEIELLKSISEKAEFIFSDDGSIRCCLFADKHTSETEKAIALGCGLSFAGIKKLKIRKLVKDFFIDDECLHIVIRKDVFVAIASVFDLSRVED